MVGIGGLFSYIGFNSILYVFVILCFYAILQDALISTTVPERWDTNILGPVFSFLV